MNSSAATPAGDTRVSVLTPPGTGAIATVAVAGPRAWGLVRWLVRPAGTRPLPESPELHRVWFGTLGEGTGDEVVLAVTRTEPEPAVEVHCHGGRRVVRWVVEQFTARGCVETTQDGEEGGSSKPTRRDGWALNALQRAPTLRTASILLDQYHGAFDRAVAGILAHLDAGRLEDARGELGQLAAYARVGRHLVEPWKVVVAGPPNVGKSSLVNALAGYQRAVVSDVAGTTRDVVTTAVAFDGWPVELADTAGLRDAAGLEAAGIDLARRALAEADLIVWLIDGSVPRTIWPEWGTDIPKNQTALLVQTKADLPSHPGQESAVHDTLPVSAVTGQGVPGLVSAIARTLVPHQPPAGVGVPFTPQLVDAAEAAHTALSAGRTVDAAGILRATVPSA
jgi:tRNA modification GTPase